MSFFEDIGRNKRTVEPPPNGTRTTSHSIPLGNSKYNFEHYAPDLERVELYGSTEAALNNVLEGHVPSSTNTENAKGDSEVLDIDAGDYEDLPEPVAQGPGGRPIDTKLISLAIRCYKKDDLSKTHMFRCAGTNTGCTTVWKSKNRVKRRILVHAATCEHLPRKLKEKLDGGLAMDAPSAKSAVLNGVTATSPKARHLSPDVTVTAKSQPSVAPLAKKARLEALTAQLHADVVQLFCVGGLPPSKVDLPEWKSMWLHAVPSYVPVSASKLEEYQIPAEAALVRMKQLEHLRTCINLSITFDGQTTHLPESVYTIHVITPDRRVYFFEGNEGFGSITYCRPPIWLSRQHAVLSNSSWALMDPERTKRPPSKPTVKFRDLDSTLFDVDLDSNGQKRKHDNSESQAEANPEPQDSNSDSEDNWLEESEDPEIERDPMYRSCDTRVLVGSEDAHLDAPRLLDLLSEKPVGRGKQDTSTTG
ncbi:hypothetical protein DFH29DRAFT_1084188 [Suillus ampliporus]|nr:hypothetical protein DFH29DRAFT_1084188 [Suillus ampliporus]